MTTVVTRSMSGAVLHNRDGDVRRVGDDVVDGRALLRLRDEGLDVLLRCVRVDLERDLDVVVAVPHVAVDAENAADVYLAFEGRLDRTQLDAAVLRDRCDAGRETARETDEDVLDRRDAAILGREDLRMIGLERGLRLVLLLLAESVETVDVGFAVGAALPLAGRPPREFGCVGGAFQRFA